MGIFKKIYKVILNVLFPKKCFCCGQPVENHFFCNDCLKQIKFTETNKLCHFCGREKDFCLCKRFVYHFKALTTVFWYDGVAKTAFLKYKFGSRAHYYIFLAKSMEENIKNVYKDIEFDYICFVPSDKRGRLRRGFDHIFLIAKHLSESMNIPLSFCIKSKSVKNRQHNIPYNMRFKNIKNRFFIDNNLSCKRVLLIDDVTTTGATLDECSRLLLFAGVEEVYCATAFGVYKKRDKS